MKTLNNIGIDVEQAKILNQKLNTLLANYQVFYMNTRGLHWNIRGEKFFELHAKFEELYSNLLLKTDEIAERILTLGGSPLHSFSDYAAQSNIPEQQNISAAKLGLTGIVESFKVLLVLQRELLVLTADANDEGTNALMSDYIREQEKLVWMYAAYLN